MLRYYEKLGVDNTWYAGKQETAIFRAPDEENDRQLRKGHHHRQYPRQQMQRKTTTCLDQRHTDWTDLLTNKVLQMVWARKCWRDVVRRAAKVRNNE